MKKRIGFLLAITCMLSLFASACTLSQRTDDYPSKPVTVILQFAPGGGGDQYLLALKPYLEKYLDGTIVIDYKAGASSQIGNEYLFSSEPDGYTIAFLSTPHVFVSQLLQNTKYKYDDFYPIGQHALDGVIFYTLKGSGIETFEDMIAAARKKPGELTIASGSLASDFGVAIKTVEQENDIQFAFIPTEGGAQTLQGVLGGHFTIGAHRPASALGAQDQLKGLVVFSEERDPSWPDVPTIYELMPGIDLPPLGSSKGLMCTVAFKEKYPDRYEKLVEAFRKTAEDPEFLEMAERQGWQVNYLTPDEVMEQMHANFAIYSDYKDLISN